MIIRKIFNPNQRIKRRDFADGNLGGERKKTDSFSVSDNAVFGGFFQKIAIIPVRLGQDIRHLGIGDKRVGLILRINMDPRGRAAVALEIIHDLP